MQIRKHAEVPKTAFLYAYKYNLLISYVPYVRDSPGFWYFVLYIMKLSQKFIK